MVGFPERRFSQRAGGCLVEDDLSDTAAPEVAGFDNEMRIRRPILILQRILREEI